MLCLTIGLVPRPGVGGGRHSAEGNMGTMEVFEEPSIVYTYHGPRLMITVDRQLIHKTNPSCEMHECEIIDLHKDAKKLDSKYFTADYKFRLTQD